MDERSHVRMHQTLLARDPAGLLGRPAVSSSRAHARLLHFNNRPMGPPLPCRRPPPPRSGVSVSPAVLPPHRDAAVSPPANRWMLNQDPPF